MDAVIDYLILCLRLFLFRWRYGKGSSRSEMRKAWSVAYLVALIIDSFVSDNIDIYCRCVPFRL
jgi:hypothetical protein